MLKRLFPNPATRAYLKQLPLIRHYRQLVMRSRRLYQRHFGQVQFRRQLHATDHPRIVIGAWDRFDAGWIPTQRDFLDLTKPDHWQVIEPGSVHAMLAEHVWEHITEDQGRAAARLCYRYLKPGGYLRVAVPDGLLPDPAYVSLVRAGDGPVASNEGNAANHKALYTYRSLAEVFTDAGFRVELYEWFDETGEFHYQPWDMAKGTIWRSLRKDPRQGRSVYPGTMHDYLGYSSIILDAVKP